MPTCHALCQALGKQDRVSYSSCESISPSLAEAYRLSKQKLHETMRQTSNFRTENAWFCLSKPGKTRTVFNDSWHVKEVIVPVDRKKICLLRKGDTEAVWSVSWYCFCREISYDHSPLYSDLYSRRHYKEERASADSSVAEGLSSK